MDDKENKEWIIRIEKAKEHNNELLIEFRNWLKKKSLKPDTIENHINNIEFYANNFLLRYEIIQIEKGFLEIGQISNSELNEIKKDKTDWIDEVVKY